VNIFINFSLTEIHYGSSDKLRPRAGVQSQLRITGNALLRGLQRFSFLSTIRAFHSFNLSGYPDSPEKIGVTIAMEDDTSFGRRDESYGTVYRCGMWRLI